MPRRAPLRRPDLRGAARLVTDATTGLTDLVEALHARVGQVPGLGAPAADGRTRGVSALVYRGIRGATRLVGGSLDALLGLLEPALEPEHTAAGAEREAIVAALNGVLGDYLAATSNPLATPLALRRGGRPLALERDALAAAMPEAGPRLLLLIHGLCMNDLQWLRDGHDHGAYLAQTQGWTPVYLHYNSGQHISITGRQLARELERLVEQWPRPLERLALLGHSMGGLVARSAIHQASAAGLRWPARLGDLVCLGTPHHGAPLERAGHWIDQLLGAAPYAAPFARLGKLRSAGITDLRHGLLLDEDWVGRDRFARGADQGQPVPLPAGVRCAAVAASLGRTDGDLKARLLGDGLVPLDSALGRHADPARTLAFDADRQWVAHGLGHLGLLSSTEVAARLRQWLA